MEQFEEINNRFTYHNPDKAEDPEKTKEAYITIRGKIKEITKYMCTVCPETRELSLAMTKLEEAVMWANASIARNGLRKE